MKHFNKLVLIALTAVCVIAGVSSAVPTYYFGRITNNSLNGDVIGGQLSVEVTNPGLVADGQFKDRSQVAFTFYNTGAFTATIAEIYFDDDVPILFPPPEVTNGSGVNFIGAGSPLKKGEHVVKPGNLPGGFSDDMSSSFDSVEVLSAEALNSISNGVDLDESVTLTFMLYDGETYGNVLDALDSGELKIGLHVHRIARIDGDPTGEDDFSEGYVTTVVPVPGAFLLGGLGTVCVGWMKRRRAL